MSGIRKAVPRRKNIRIGPYSFINMSHSAESLNEQRSSKNVFEVVVVSEIIRKLFAENFEVCIFVGRST
ncbi:hypothetical protein H6P81_020075 [Aristolochia fimbriata]|uniref:Uncharacterized protein n=1 Tax=Aristolochia fimbriata TaxID=158543 RepID=A0AAV7DTD6_ARIFI|nr:hypothetical protein H6P81_020075 [Aristolochia fimbriata]